MHGQLHNVTTMKRPAGSTRPMPGWIVACIMALLLCGSTIIAAKEGKSGGGKSTAVEKQDSAPSAHEPTASIKADELAEFDSQPKAGSSDGRSCAGKPRYGVSVFDFHFHFHFPHRGQPKGGHSRFLGYANML